MSLLNQNIGSVDFDNLVIRAGAAGHVQIAADQGALKKGSVINADGELYDGGEGSEPRFILCDDTETDEDGAVTAAVWKTGNFVRNSLVVADEYELTDADAEALRDYGIIIEDAQGGAAGGDAVVSGGGDAAIEGEEL